MDFTDTVAPVQYCLVDKSIGIAGSPVDSVHLENRPRNDMGRLLRFSERSCNGIFTSLLLFRQDLLLPKLMEKFN